MEKRALPRFQALCGTFTPTAAISFSKLTKFNTRFKLQARVVKLHSHRTFSSPFSKKCVYPNHRLSRLRQRLRRDESSRTDARPAQLL